MSHDKEDGSDSENRQQVNGKANQKKEGDRHQFNTQNWIDTNKNRGLKRKRKELPRMRLDVEHVTTLDKPPVFMHEGFKAFVNKYDKALVCLKLLKEQLL